MTDRHGAGHADVAAEIDPILDRGNRIGRLIASAGYFAVAGVCALFGVIHSPLLDERIDLPNTVIGAIAEPFALAAKYQTPYHWAAGYGLMAVLLVGLAFVRPAGRDSR